MTDIITLSSEETRVAIHALMERGEAITDAIENWDLEAGRLFNHAKTHGFYREWGFKTLEAYLKTNYDITRQRYYQLRDYDAVIRSLPDNLSTIVDKTEPPKPVTSVIRESHARVLKPVPEEKREAVIREAAQSDDGLTAKSLKEAVKVVAPSAPAPVQFKDCTGWPVPVEIQPLFHRQERVKKLMHEVSMIRGVIRRVMQAENEPMFRECDLQGMEIHCDNLYQQLKLAVPFAVCPYCHGITWRECTACRGRGVVSQHLWDNVVPEEMKRMRAQALEDEG